MGYEIAAGLGVRLAAPDREVFVLVGDGSYLMMAQEIATSIQEGVRLIILILDNHGFASIGGLSQSVGCAGYATSYRARDPRTGQLDGELLTVDYVANAASLGAHAVHARTREEIRDAIAAARRADRTTAIVIPVDREQRIGGGGVVVGRADCRGLDDRGRAVGAEPTTSAPRPPNAAICRDVGSWRQPDVTGT